MLAFGTCLRGNAGLYGTFRDFSLLAEKRRISVSGWDLNGPTRSRQVDGNSKHIMIGNPICHSKPE